MMPMKSILTQLEERGEVAFSRTGKEKEREREGEMKREIQVEMTGILSLFPHFVFLITSDTHLPVLHVASERGCILTLPSRVLIFFLFHFVFVLSLLGFLHLFILTYVWLAATAGITAEPFCIL